MPRILTAIPSYTPNTPSAALAAAQSGLNGGIDPMVLRANQTDSRTLTMTSGATTVLAVSFDASGRCNGSSQGMTSAAFQALSAVDKNDVNWGLATMGDLSRQGNF